MMQWDKRVWHQPVEYLDYKCFYKEKARIQQSSHLKMERENVSAKIFLILGFSLIFFKGLIFVTTADLSALSYFV